MNQSIIFENVLRRVGFDIVLADTEGGNEALTFLRQEGKYAGPLHPSLVFRERVAPSNTIKIVTVASALQSSCMVPPRGGLHSDHDLRASAFPQTA